MAAMACLLAVAAPSASSAAMPMMRALDRIAAAPGGCLSTLRSGHSDVELVGKMSLIHLHADMCSDVWGYVSPSQKEYMILGCQGRGGVVKFLRVAEDGTLAPVAEYGGAQSSWYDIRTYGHYAFVVTEAPREIPVWVFDLSAIDDGRVTPITPPDFERTTPRNTHNVAIDVANGFLYRCVGAGDALGAYIYEIRDQDFGSYTWPLRAQILGECHDIHVETIRARQVAFVSAGSLGAVLIYDVTDKDAITLLRTLEYPHASYTHQLSIDDSQRYLYLNDEMYIDNVNVLRSTVIIFDISDLATARYIRSYDNGEIATTHNMFALGDRLFQANYDSGLRVYDITDRENITEVSHYDTQERRYPGWSGGLWGVYPYLPSGYILGSDITCGAHVFSYAPRAPTPGPSPPLYYTCRYSDTELTSIQDPEQPMTFRDVLVYTYAYLGYVNDTVVTSRMHQCLDYDRSGEITFSEISRTFYVYLGYVSL